jgi:hypothetical protein
LKVPGGNGSVAEDRTRYAGKERGEGDSCLIFDGKEDAEQGGTGQMEGTGDDEGGKRDRRKKGIWLW